MLGCNHQKWIEMGELVVEPLEKLGTGRAIQVTSMARKRWYEWAIDHVESLDINHPTSTSGRRVPFPRDPSSSQFHEGNTEGETGWERSKLGSKKVSSPATDIFTSTCTRSKFHRVSPCFTHTYPYSMTRHHPASHLTWLDPIRHHQRQPRHFRFGEPLLNSEKPLEL